MTGRDGSRESILDALLTLLSTRGADALTIRNVAAEAGVSVGAVQHHFATRDALIVAAMTTVNERFIARMRELIAQEPSAEVRLRIFCRELAAIGSGDLTEAIVWNAFTARAGTHADIRALHAANWAGTEYFILQLLTGAYPNSDATADDAALLLAVADGIAVARAAEQSDRMTPERAERLIEGVLDAIARRGSETPVGELA